MRIQNEEKLREASEDEYRRKVEKHKALKEKRKLAMAKAQTIWLDKVDREAHIKKQLD